MRSTFRALKAQGFSDARLAKLTGQRERDVRAARRKLGVRPQFKRIDSCAAEFRATTPYMYSTYEFPAYGSEEAECEAEPSDRNKIIILGGGPNRIGQGIEFDYCCCHAAFACAEIGVESIMVNCNPETVSTDYDTSDRLYFEPLTTEDVLEIVETEKSRGTVQGLIVQFGGQTPLKLAQPLADEGAPILGTSVDAIDLAEDRDRFQALLRKIGLKQPDNTIAASPDAARAGAAKIGYPVMLRPSYVLGGLAMQIVHNEGELDDYITRISRALGGPSELAISDKKPLLVDCYLRDAIEVDVDAICDGEDVFVAGVMEHIEEAGVHSGDSACALPPYSLSKKLIDEIEAQTKKLALALDVRGLINIQFAVKDDEIFILEANPRASRTAPFVAKAINRPIAAAAAKVMAGMKLSELKLDRPSKKHVAVKEAVFPFARFPGVDPVLGPEMRSTGEVMGLDESFVAAFAKSQIASGINLPVEGCCFISVKNADKPALVAGRRKRPDRTWLPRDGDRRHRRLPHRQGHRSAEGQQGRRGPAAHRRRHEERRSPARLQHDRRRPILSGQLFDPSHGAGAEHSLLYDRVRRAGGHPGHPVAQIGGASRRSGASGLCLTSGRTGYRFSSPRRTFTHPHGKNPNDRRGLSPPSTQS